MEDEMTELNAKIHYEDKVEYKRKFAMAASVEDAWVRDYEKQNSDILNQFCLRSKINPDVNIESEE